MDRCSPQEMLSLISKDAQTLDMFRSLVNGGFVRVVNYHNTNPAQASRLEREVRAYSELFSPVTLRDLDEFFATRRWPHKKPGLIPAVFEGFRSHHDVMLPILNKYHFTGWFYVPSFYMDVPVQEQLEFSEAHELDLCDKTVYPDGRYAMNWDEVRAVAKDHEICCHTGSHFQITRETSDEDMRREIVDSKNRLAEQIGRAPRVFCWLYGGDYGFNTRAQPYIREAGYDYVLGNLKIEKIR